MNDDTKELLLHYLHKADDMKSFYRFSDYYESCVRTARENADKKHGTEIHVYTYAKPRCENYLHEFIKLIDTSHEAMFTEIAPKLHAYIRENGLPEMYPMHISNSSRYFACEGMIDDSVPFKGERVCMEFQFCGPLRRYTVDNRFQDYYMDRDGETVMLKSRLRRPDFRPSWSNSYDGEFTELGCRADSMREAIGKDRDKLDSTIQELELYKGNLLSGAARALGKIALAAGMAAFSAFGVFLIIALFSSLILNIEIGFMPLIAQIIIGLIVGGVFLSVLILCFSSFEILKFVRDHRERKVLRKKIAMSESEIAGREKELEDFCGSDVYRAAERRNNEAYEEDCRLAEEWQTKWYQQCLKITPELFIIDNE